MPTLSGIVATVRQGHTIHLPTSIAQTAIKNVAITVELKQGSQRSGLTFTIVEGGATRRGEIKRGEASGSLCRRPRVGFVGALVRGDDRDSECLRFGWASANLVMGRHCRLVSINAWRDFVVLLKPSGLLSLVTQLIMTSSTELGTSKVQSMVRFGYSTSCMTWN